MDGIDKFWISIGIFIGVIFGITCGVFLSLFSWFSIKYVDIKHIDAISIANTYIVFISIIFILFTIAVTIGGYIFAKIFSTEKIKEIHQNIVIISNQLKTNVETRELFIDELLKDESFIDHVKENVRRIIKQDEESLEEEEQRNGELKS